MLVRTWTAAASLVEEALAVVLRSISQTSSEPLEEVVVAVAFLEVADAVEVEEASMVDSVEAEAVSLVVSPVEVASMTISTLVVADSVVPASPLALADPLLPTSTNMVALVAEVDNKPNEKDVSSFLFPLFHFLLPSHPHSFCSSARQ